MAGISKKRIKTKKGYITKYTITYRDVFGKQHTSGVYETLKEAKKHLYKFEEIKPDSNEILLEQIYKLFLDKAKTKYAQSTYDTYNTYYKKYLQEIKKIKYNKITSIALQSFFDDLEKSSSPFVAQHVLKLSRAACNYAKKHKIIKHNIFEEVEKINLPKSDINHLTVDELQMILKECKKSYPEYYVLLYTFIGTGAREGEIFALIKDDFDEKEGTLTISKQYTQRRLVLNTKTEDSKRKIFLFDELKQEIKKHIEKSGNKCALLFPNKSGGYIDAANFRKRFFYNLLKLCGINKRVRLHDLRGSYIDMVLSSGLSVKFAQNQVGHARAETTLNIYARNNGDMVKNATERLNNIFQKCEQNVSIREKRGDSKIISFPRKTSEERI